MDKLRGPLPFRFNFCASKVVVNAVLVRFTRFSLSERPVMMTEETRHSRAVPVPLSKLFSVLCVNPLTVGHTRISFATPDTPSTEISEVSFGAVCS